MNSIKQDNRTCQVPANTPQGNAGNFALYGFASPARGIHSTTSQGFTRPESHRGRSIRLVPGLNIAALAARPRKDKELILWYCLRAIDNGRGVLDQLEAIDILKESFGYKRATAYKHLVKGDGLFWRLYRTRQGRDIIILAGIQRVVIALNASITHSQHFMELAIDKLPDSSHTQARRALLYGVAAYKPIGTRNNRPISRRSLEDKTGINSRQQRRYDAALTGQGKLLNWETKSYYRDPVTYRLHKHCRLVDKGLDGMVDTCQLPNRYSLIMERGNRGILHNVKGMNQSLINGEANVMEPRRYFNGFKDYYKAVFKGKTSTLECYYPARNNESHYILGDVWN